MRSAPVLAAVALGTVALAAGALAAGCGRQHQGTPAGPPLGGASSASPEPGAPAAATCHGTAARRAALITITYADNGRTLCVRRGTAVQVFLKGTPANRWSAIRVSNAVLKPHANGRLMLALGVTGASFLAVHPGTVAITSFRQVCGPNATPPNAAAQSGTLECGVILGFRATVKVI
jgi:hypothetical protein